jgi:4-amino-4-deoxy-L-arabinose transferase-like glycosyltransferase
MTAVVAGDAASPALASGANRRRLRETILLGLLTVGAFLPFAGTAFKIDDPLFIWCAQQIAGHPLDPYGFSVNWFGVEMPMWEVMRNPPLASYYLALFGSAFGWGEPALHAAMILAAIACVLGTAVLCRRFAASGFLGGALLLTMPVFLLSGTTVMCDIPMLALLVWAAVFWVAGVDEGRTGNLLASAMLLSAAVLTKFSALLILPAFMLYGWKRIRWPRLGVLALPLLVLLFYLLAAAARYGGSLLDALAMASAGEEAGGAGMRLMVFFTFLGGCCLTLTFVLPWLWPKKWIPGVLGFGALAGIVIGAGWNRDLMLQKLSLADPLAAIQAALFAGGAAVCIGICIAQWRADRRAASLLLPWIAAIMLFAAFATWSMSGRYLLPLAPALAIGTACIIERRVQEGTRRLVFQGIAIVVMGAVSLFVVHGDALLADSARSAAVRIADTYGPGVWFQGHWGFQYYMEQRGGRALDAQSSRLGPGEVLVVPDNNTNTFPLDRRMLKLRETLEIRTFSRISTMNRQVRSGFYASVWGPLPYAVGVISPEKYYILSIVSP